MLAALLTFKSVFRDAMTENFTRMAKKYEISTISSMANKETQDLDEFQTRFGCCGVRGPDDWEAWRPDITKLSYPRSCCTRTISTLDAIYSCPTPFEQGCLDSFSNSVLTRLLMMTILSILLDLALAYIGLSLANYYELETSLPRNQGSMSNRPSQVYQNQI